MAQELSLDAEMLKQLFGRMAARLAATSVPGALHQAVVDIAMDATTAEACSLYLEDPGANGGAANTISMVACAGFEESRVGRAVYKAGEGLTAWIWQNSTSIKCDSTQEVQNDSHGWQGRYDGLVKDQHPQWVCRSLVGVPLRLGDRTIGVLKVENKSLRVAQCFSASDLALLELLASTMALAIENRRISERAFQYTLAALREVSGMLVSDLAGSFGLLCSRIVDTCVSLFNAEASSLYLEQSDDGGSASQTITMVAGAGYEVRRMGSVYQKGQGLTGSIWQNGDPVKFDTEEALHATGGSWKGLHDQTISRDDPEWRCCSLIGAPLRVGDRTIGVLKVENKKPTPGAQFSSQELQTLQLIASNIAVAVQMLAQHRRIFLKGELARSFAHDALPSLRTCVGNLSDAIVDLSAEGDAANVGRPLRKLELIRIELERLWRKVRGTAAGAKAERHQELVDVVELARSVAEAWESTFSKYGISPTLVLPATPVYVEVDRAEVHAALVNIVSNAHEALVTLPSDQARELVLRVTRPATDGGADLVSIDVTDSGPGLSPDQRAEFGQTTRVQSTKGKQRGSGLHEAWRCCRDEGGWLRCEPTPSGTGTTFVISLPAAEPHQSPVRLLVVDDNETYCGWLQLAADECPGVSVEGCSSPQVLTSAAPPQGQPSPDDYDWVLLDCQFDTGENGVAIYDHLQQNRPQLARKVVLVSSYPGQREARHDPEVMVCEKDKVHKGFREFVAWLRSGRRAPCAFS